MMLIRLWKYLRGYVIIEVYGFGIERLINMSAYKGLLLWNLHREGNKLLMSVGLGELKKVHQSLIKTGCKVRIREKKGLPFILHRYKKRKIFILGALITCMVLFFLSSLVWRIEIQGNERYGKNEVLMILKKYGCDVGKVKYNIESKKIEDDILLDYPDIAWISLEVRGSALIVTMVETVEQPDFKVKDLPPADLVADKKCLIEYIVTRAGQPTVKKGDVVTKGQVLVTGEMEILNDDQSIRYQYVHADADIFGRVYYVITDSIKLDYIEKNYTGKEKKDVYFNMGSLALKIWRPFKYDQFSDEIQSQKNFFFLDYELPIGFSSITYVHYIPVKKRYTKEEATSILKKRLTRSIKKAMDTDVEIIDQNTQYNIGKNKITSETQLIVIEKVGVVEEIKERTEEWTEENP